MSPSSAAGMTPMVLGAAVSCVIGNGCWRRESSFQSGVEYAGNMAMKRLVLLVTAFGLLVAGCGSTSVRPALTYPTRFDNIPVYRVSWNSTLPYVSKSMYIAWSTNKPTAYIVSPRSAIARAIDTWPNLQKNATSIYIQATGLTGGRTGNPSSAYVVEFVGPDLGLNGAPTFTKPKLQFVIAIVNGSSGKAEMAVGGGYPVAPTTSSPSAPINPMQLQHGGLSAAVKYLARAAATASYGDITKAVKQTKVANGFVVSISQPWPITAVFVDQKTGAWVGLPLGFAVNTFERQTSNGSLLFLTQGPMGDGTYSPFPAQELCSPQPDGAFKCQQGPAYFPITAQNVRFGSKPNEALTTVIATSQGLKFVFGHLQYADYLSIPPTTVEYNATDKTLAIDFSDTTLDGVSGLPALQSQYIESVSVASSGQDAVVTVHLTPAAAYYTGSINVPAGPTAFLEIDFATTPPAPPWGP